MRKLVLFLLLAISTSVFADYTVIWSHPDPASIDGFNVYQRDNTDPVNPGTWTSVSVPSSEVSMDVVSPDGAYCVDVTATKDLVGPPATTVETPMSSVPVCFTQATTTLENPVGVDVNAPQPIGGSFVIITK